MPRPNSPYAKILANIPNIKNFEERINTQTLKVTRTSVISWKTREMILPITEEQWQHYMNGTFIQTSLGHLTPAQREFILSGADDADWESLKEPDEDEKDDFDAAF